MKSVIAGVSLCYSSLYINPKVAKALLILIQENVPSPHIRPVLGLFADTANKVIEWSGVILMMQTPAQ